MDLAAFESFPEMETERVILRETTLEDIDMVHEFNRYENTMRFVPRALASKRSEAEKRTRNMIASFKDRAAVWWVFQLKESGQAFGYGGFFDIDLVSQKAELGYGTIAPFWGRGLMGEVLPAMMAFGMRRMQFHRIHAEVDPSNHASIRLLERNSFQKEGHLREAIFARGRFFDMLLFARLQSDPKKELANI